MQQENTNKDLFIEGITNVIEMIDGKTLVSGCIIGIKSDGYIEMRIAGADADSINFMLNIVVSNLLAIRDKMAQEQERRESKHWSN